MEDFKNTEEIREYLLSTSLPEGLGLKTERRGASLYVPELQTIITPVVHPPQRFSLGVDFHLYSEKWNKRFYEYCGGPGKDLRSSAAMASSMFLFGFMDGYKRISQNAVMTGFTQELEGKNHEWNVVISDLASLGETVDENIDSATRYWEPLKEEIMRRLGNQMLVYIKVYAAKFSNDTIGEVRFDDVEIPELSAIVKSMAEKWEVDQFASEKQFFFIEQTPSTYIPSEYDGEEGFRKMRSKVVEYLLLFEAATTQELYNRLYEDAKNRLGDATLAAECKAFLPEIAAIHALDGRVKINDKVRMVFPDGRQKDLYLSQLSDYLKLEDCLGDIINKKDFGDETNKLLNDLIGCSSIISVLDQARKGGSQIENLSPISMLFNMQEEFEIR